MTSMEKQSQKITKKEARAYYQRVKLFLHFVISNHNGKSVMLELVNLCHDVLSQCEGEIFNVKLKDTQQSIFGSQYSFLSNQLSDLSASVTALKQLTKRIKINLIFEPYRMEDLIKQETDPSQKTEDAKEDESSLGQQQPFFGKAKS